MSDLAYRMRIRAARGIHKISQAAWEADPSISRLGVTAGWLNTGTVSTRNDRTAQQIYNSIYRGSGASAESTQTPLTVQEHIQMSAMPKTTEQLLVDEINTLIDLTLNRARHAEQTKFAYSINLKTLGRDRYTEQLEQVVRQLCGEYHIQCAGFSQHAQAFGIDIDLDQVRLSSEQLKALDGKAPHPQIITPRGHALLWSHPGDVPIVTLEAYDKWYDMWVLFPDGHIEKVPTGVLNELMDDVEGNLRFDHAFHPKLLLKVAKHYKGEADQLSLEVAAGRWAMEVNEEYGLELSDYKDDSK